MQPDDTRIAARGISAAPRPISWLARSLAMRIRLSWDILRQSRTFPSGRRLGAPIAPASSRCLLLSRSQSCLCTRMPPRSLRFTLCSLPSCADSHASDENPEVHQLSCDGPVAFEQNICPRLSANGRFLRVNIRPSGATITWVALSALHVTLPLARLYCRPHNISKML